MASYVDIANQAASKIGEDDQLRTPDDDTHLGRTVAAVWARVRRAAIRSHTWNFAMHRAALTAQVLDYDPYPWEYSFPLPADNVRLVEVLNLTDDAYQIEGKAILCNSAGPVYIRYLRDREDVALWEESFADVMVAQLALQIGVRIAGSSYDVVEGRRLLKDAISTAVRVDARENPPVEQDLTGWEQAYLGGASYVPRPGDGGS